MASVAHPAAEIVAIALKKILKNAHVRRNAALIEEAKSFLEKIHTIIPAQPSAPTAHAGKSLGAGPSPVPGISPEAKPNSSPIASTEPASTDVTKPPPDAPQTATVTATAVEPPPLQQEPTTPQQSPRKIPKGVEASAQSNADSPYRVEDSQDPMNPDLVPRTETAMSDETCLRILAMMRLATESDKGILIETALDCIQKLIAFSFLQGAAYHINLSRLGMQSGGQISQGQAATCTPQALAIELMCSCDEVPDEGVELHILKGLLTATTSSTFTIHGQALLLAVRTCYNIYLMSRSEVNQTTAKASLTQMLNVVFQRMEADSLLIEVKPILVADVLGISKLGHPEIGAPSILTVQTFLNNVVMVATHGGQTPEEIRRSVAASIHNSAPLIPAGAGTQDAAAAAAACAATDSDDEREQFNISSVTSRLRGDLATSIGGLAPEGEQPPTGGEGSSDVGGLGRADSITGGGPGGGRAQSNSSGGLRPTDAAEARTSLMRKDAFLVFRALCKLSIRTSDAATVMDPTAVRGKVLALELLKILLENSGPMFQHSDKFLSAIRQYLCLSLLKNSASSVPQAMQLTCSIFLSLLTKFRLNLKAEIAYFFPMILLKPFEPGAVPAISSASPATAANTHIFRTFLMRVLSEMSRDGQLLVDIFVNYDCDLESSNLFERMVNSVVKVAQQHIPAPHPQYLTSDAATNHAQELMLRQEALLTLVNISESLLSWYRATTALGESDAAAAAAAMASAASAMVTENGVNPLSAQIATAASPLGLSMLGREPFSATSATTTAATTTTARSSSAANFKASPLGAAEGSERGGDSSCSQPTTPQSAAGSAGGAAVTPGTQAAEPPELGAKRAYKAKFLECIALFNKKPKKGIEAFQREGMVGSSPEEIAKFLCKTQGLDKSEVGSYISEREDFNIKVMHAIIDAHDFQGLDFDAAIRTFLESSGFRLPGEAQKIDRLMEKFAERYLRCNPGSFKSADVAYVLAYSVIMLNTDAHNPSVKVKMSKDGFLRNNRGINDGQDLDPDFMEALYDRIVNNEIQLKDDLSPGVGGQVDSSDNNEANIIQMFFFLMGGKQHVSTEPSDEAIKRTLEFLQEKAKGSTAVTVTEPEVVRPIMEVIWAPLLGALSVLFDEYSDPRLVRLTLSGFSATCCLCSLANMTNLRDVYCNGLCNFTHLHSPATMKLKNALAFKALLQVAQSVGNQLQERWMDVLRCISRWELLQQMASGTPTDAVLFSPAEAPRSGRPDSKGGKKGAKDSDGDLQTSMESLAMNEMSIKMHQSNGNGKMASKDSSMQMQPEVINSCDAQELNMVFLRSYRLDSEAIVIFVRALCSISLEELRVADALRVFSLTKIVEIAHYNMKRIRLVWSRIWAVLADYFIGVGCHSNLSVAMYAVDSLRQLAMKFLERDELTNYSFQNDFLRPFVVLMRQSQAVEIRELIIRCLSQMVLARVNNVKSGWKSMFMVFTTAAGDRDPTIVRLAFETIEKIVREHFKHITETETTTFTDCVNCLIAFTSNPHSLPVALNSIDFLRFCAQKLADGAESQATPSTPPQLSLLTSSPPKLASLSLNGSQSLSLSASATLHQYHLMDKEEAVYFWFPLLAGLSELTFDPMPEIRNRSLEVLFDILQTHGSAFDAPFWQRIFDSILLPIFDYVRAEVFDTTALSSERKKAREDAWLYETCTMCLRKMVDVFVLHYASMPPSILTQLLELLQGFMRRLHTSLAAVSVAALVRLCTTAATSIEESTWLQMVDVFKQATTQVSPDLRSVVTPPLPGSEIAGSDEEQAGESSSTLSSPEEATSSSNREDSNGLASHSNGNSTYSLREGVGASRLARFRAQASVQLLLVQGASEVYAALQGSLPPAALSILLHTLESISSNARSLDMDVDLRRQLALAQAEDGVPEEQSIPDPPLVRLEAEASHAFLSVLMHLNLQAATPPSLGVPTLMASLCLSVLRRFAFGARTASGPIFQQSETLATSSMPSSYQAASGVADACATPPLPDSPGPTTIIAGRTAAGLPVLLATPASEYAPFTPLLLSTLKAIARLDDVTLKGVMPLLGPVLTRVLQAHYTPPEIHVELAYLWSTRIQALDA